MQSTTTSAGATTKARVAHWVTQGFEGFREGHFGNGGHNLYVSRKGVLQRIHHHDINADGYIDLLFCNSQDHWEVPPSYEYRWNGRTLKKYEIPLKGASAGTVADLNGDGRPDLITGLWYNGVGFDSNATVFYGQETSSMPRWGEQAIQLLSAPLCVAVAAGDFNGDGHVDVAMACHKNLRIYYQGETGLRMKSFIDLPIAAEMLASADLDGDGFHELVARFASGRVRIYWGGKDGIAVDRFTDVDIPGDNLPPELSADAVGERPASVEWVQEPFPQVRVIWFDKTPHIFVARAQESWLVPLLAGRAFGNAVKIPVADIMSIAAGDLDGDGHPDLAFACRDRINDSEYSFVLWGNHADGWNQEPTRLKTDRASDVAIGDFDGDGRYEVAFSQSYNADWFTRNSPIYKFDGHSPALWQEVVAHDPRFLFAVPNPDGAGDSLVVINRQGRNRVGEVPATIYLGNAEGFSPDRAIQLPGWGATVGVMADLNDDGICDVVMANTAENSVDRDPGSYVYIQGRNGFPDKPSQILPTKRAHGIACADIDCDGYLEVIFAGFSNDEIVIFRSGPNGFDTENPIRIKAELDGRVYEQHRFIQLADINGDGWLDLILTLIDCDHTLVLWGGPDGFDMKRSQKLDVWHPVAARAADLDGDGYLDLIFGGHMPSTEGPQDSFVHIYWNGPDGLREDRKTLLPCFAANSMAIADFNNDGNLDLFVNSYQMSWKKRDTESFLYWNRGGRGFSSQDFTRLFTHSASGDLAADFNEDGWIDLAVASHKKYGDHSALSQVWWNGPDGFEEKNITWLPTNGPHGMQTPGPGNIMDRGPEEYYTSVAYEFEPGATVERITWDAELPPKTWVHAQVRFARTKAALAAAEWQGPTGGNSWFAKGAEIDSSLQPQNGGWMQYRLALGATNSGSSPRVTRVTVQFTN